MGGGQKGMRERRPWRERENGMPVREGMLRKREERRAVGERKEI